MLVCRIDAWKIQFPLRMAYSQGLLLVEEILHHLRLVVYPIIYMVLSTSNRWLLGISEPSTGMLVFLGSNDPWSQRLSPRGRSIRTPRAKASASSAESMGEPCSSAAVRTLEDTHGESGATLGAGKIFQ